MARAGKPTPLDDQPKNDWETHDFLGAFNRLSFSRTRGMDMNPIALSEMAFYWNTIDRIGRLDDFINIIQQLDALFLTHRQDNSDNG